MDGEWHSSEDNLLIEAINLLDRQKYGEVMSSRSPDEWDEYHATHNILSDLKQRIRGQNSS